MYSNSFDWEPCGKGPTPDPNATFTPCATALRKAALRNLRHAMPRILLHVALSVQLIVIKCRDKIDAFLHHHLDVSIFQIHSVLERIDSSIQAVAKAFPPKGVARNFAPFLVSLFHNRVDFFRRERWRNDHFAIGSEVKIVRRIQLNQIRIMRNLVPHRLTSSPRRVDYLQCRQELEPRWKSPA